MKYLMITVLALLVCMPVFAYAWEDGILSSGEHYTGTIEWFDENPPFIIDGGGANAIDLWESGRIEVYNTSIPTDKNWHTGGIRDIHLNDNTHLNYLGGMTAILSVREDAVAVLKGGSINYIRTLFDFMTTGHVDIYCQPGWAWIEEDENFDGDLDKIGITGLWEDNNPFTIDFIDDDYFGYDPVWMGVNVIEVPEPISLLLLSFGGLLIRRR